MSIRRWTRKWFDRRWTHHNRHGSIQTITVSIMCRKSRYINQGQCIFTIKWSHFQNHLICESIVIVSLDLTLSYSKSVFEIDKVRANQDVLTLHRINTADALFNTIVSSQSFAQLRTIFDDYRKVTGIAIEQAIVTQFRGDIRTTLITLVNCIRNRAAFFAECIHEAIEVSVCVWLMMQIVSSMQRGNDDDLIRLIVSRSEHDMMAIKCEFQKIYQQSIDSMIRVRRINWWVYVCLLFSFIGQMLCEVGLCGCTIRVDRWRQSTTELMIEEKRCNSSFR